MDITTDNIEKLKLLLPKLKWTEHTSCSIEAHYGGHFTIVVIKGHAGNSYLKYIQVLDKNIHNEIIENIENADELVALAYSVYLEDIGAAKREFYNLLNTTQ